MSWMNQIGDLASKYAEGALSGDAENDFDQVARDAPKDKLTGGIAAALRSDQTPPLGQLVSQVFGQASGDQKAGILNTLMGAIGPALLPQILNQVGLGNLAGLLGGGNISPQQVEQVPADAVGRMAERAQEENPNVIESLSGFLSGNPGLMKSLGGGALGAIMSRLG